MLVGDVLSFFFLLQTCPGMEQYSIKMFAESLESLPRALAENAGVKVNFESCLLMLASSYSKKKKKSSQF